MADTIRLRVLPSLLPQNLELENTGTEVRYRYVGQGDDAWVTLFTIEDISATLEIGTVSTLGPDEIATVENVGTPQHVILNIGIPAGSDGLVQTLVAGDGIEVDPTDPNHPTVALRDFVTPLKFGAAMDGVTDDHDAFVDLLDYCSANNVVGLIPKGTLATSALLVTLTGDLRIVCEGTILNITGDALAANLVEITGNDLYDVKWRGGTFDANNGGWTMLRVRNCLSHIDIEIDEGFGILGNVGSPGVASMIYPSNVPSARVRPGYIHDCAQGTATAQGSVPRCVSYAAIDHLVIDGGQFFDCHAGYVGTGGESEFHGTLMVDMFDNPFYHGGGRATAYDCHLIRTDEPIVVSDFGAGDADFTFIGGSIVDPTNSLGLQDCIGLKLIGAYLRVEDLVKTRTGLNTASGHFHMMNCDVETSPLNRMMDFTAGTLDEVVLLNNRFRYIHDSANTPAALLFSWTTGVRFNIQNNSFELEDATANIANGDWALAVPAAVTQLSFWKNNALINHTGNSSANWRLTNMRQQLIEFDGVTSTQNIGEETEVNVGGLASAPPRLVWGLAAPTNGYWQRGSVVKNLTPGALSPSEWECVTAGSPGTWRAKFTPDYLTGSKTHDFPSIAAGATSQTTVTVTGAVTDDVVVGVSLNVATTDITFTAKVSSANNVSVQARNNAGSPVDLGSGTLSVVVMKKPF